MDTQVSFEAQIRQDGDWKTVGVFRDRASAVAEVERILEAKRTAGVRVRQLVFDAQNQCVEHTVYRASCIDEAPPREERARPQPRDQRAPSPRASGDVRDLRAGPRPAAALQRRSSSTLTTLSLLGLLGLSILLLLRFHS